MRKRQPSDYGLQLREKQKLKRMYGLAEKQFKGTFARADRQKGITGANLVILLERRLDNIVFRLGFASSRTEARQLVTHRHFQVGGRTVNIPSYVVKAGEEIQLRERSRNCERIKEAMEMMARRGLPAWLELDREKMKAKVRAVPAREDLTMPINEQLVVELYSK
jgi:small subunit ribosomal protein S4